MFLAISTIYLLTSAGNTPYDYFNRLSAAFLKGKYYLTDNPSWLSELVPLGGNKFTFVNPPMPAILSLPFVFLFGNNFKQQYLAHLLGAASVITTGLIAWKIKKDKRLAIWSSLLIGFGSIFWYLSATGSVWYLGQVTTFFFVNLAILESIDKKRPLVVSFLLACAVLSRPQTLIALPFFLYLLRPKLRNLKSVFYGLPIAISILLFGLYNFIRFGSVFNDGRTLIPGILREPWFNKGLFSLSYIPGHLRVMFTALPKFLNKFPFIEPSWGGLAIWITTPAFIFAIRAPLKRIETIFAWIAIFYISVVIFSFGSTGVSQFGYRYAVDFYPFLIFLTILGVSRQNLKWYHWLILFISIIVNAWGVIFINKLNFVSL